MNGWRLSAILSAGILAGVLASVVIGLGPELRHVRSW